MTQENKELLLKDLCARLPYGVKVLFGKAGIVLQLANISQDHCFPLNNSHILINKEYLIQWCKPYLRPMSSLTEEEFEDLKSYSGLMYDQLELQEFHNNSKCLEFYLSEIPSYVVILVFDWLNIHHFDYRGLIERGLALEAPKYTYK